MLRPALTVLLVTLATSAGAGQDRHPSLSGCHAVTHVRVTVEPGTVIDDATLVVRDGVITTVLSGVTAPKDAETLDGAGLHATAGFFATGPELAPKTAEKAPADPAPDGVAFPPPYERAGIRPSRTISGLLADGAELKTASWLQHGVTAVLVRPSGRIITGRAALISTVDLPSRDRVLRATSALDLRLQTGGGGYPESLMGTMALVRQWIEDVRYLEAWKNRFRVDPLGIRPPPADFELDAGIEALADSPVLFRVERPGDIGRALGLAAEFKLRPWLHAGRLANRHASEIARAQASVFLDLSRPELRYEDNKKLLETLQAATPPTPPAPTEDSKPAPTTSDAYVLDRRRELATREKEELDDLLKAAATLTAAGVPLALGATKPEDLLSMLRAAIASGLRPDDALAALTTAPARFFGLERSHGKMRQGFAADFSLWRGDPLTGGKLAHVFIRGTRHDFAAPKEGSAPAATTPPAGIEAFAGVWTIQVDGSPADSTLTLEREGTSLAGRYQSRFGEVTISSVEVKGETIRIEASANLDERTVEIKLAGTLEASKTAMNGTLGFGRGGERGFKATKGGGS